VLDPRTAYQIVSMLEGVIQRGTGQAIKVLNRPLAGKTGTSSDFRDAWFVGFSPDLTVGVFIGKDNFQTLGNGEQGALAAAPIFRDFMKEALADKPPTPFRVPQGIVEVPVNSITGVQVADGTPGAVLEAFKAGTEPGAGYTVSDINDVPGQAPVPTTTAAAVNETAQPAGSTPAAVPNPPAPANSIGTGTGGLY
ncbi:MAG: penicillin-binding protein, partial [Alphaproteobacteria bacterium]|nr:penicillin-binding protein [Alphaproteobacteria bacterium]